MPKGISIHIGVNKPNDQCCRTRELKHAEDAARRMAELAEHADFEVWNPLIGEDAKREVVLDRLREAGNALEDDDLLFISFSGHGCPNKTDLMPIDDQGADEDWCLSDGLIRDDELRSVFRLFPKARIVAVLECCHAGGTFFHNLNRPWTRRRPKRTELLKAQYQLRRRTVRITSPLQSVPQGPPTSCVPANAPANDEGIPASIIILAATLESRLAEDGLYTRVFLDVWNSGNFPGTNYCDLHEEIKKRVLELKGDQEATILVKGTRRPSFIRERPFQI